MRNHILLTFFVLFITTFAVAQKGKITGKVISAKTGETLVGASVSINYKNKATKADQNGVYSLSGLEKGTYNITCTYINYTAKNNEAFYLTITQ